MEVNFNDMNGYEFERFVAKLLRKAGFIVEETPLSGDGGVDLIAYSEKPLYKGKYIVQCKKWKDKVGEPAVRDLYGVVLSNNANKGILVTNSYFTMQAVQFAEGKNIELIDGSVLNELVNTYFGDNYIQKIQQSENMSCEISHFTNLHDFELEKYKYYKQKVDYDRKNFDAQLDLFKFMYSYVLDYKLDIIYSGLLIELIQIVDDIIKRFCSKGKKGEYYKKIFNVYKGIFYMFLGRVDEAVDILLTMKRLKFIQYTGKFDSYYVMNSRYYFYPHRYYIDRFGKGNIQYLTYVYDNDFFIYKVNLISLLILINDNSNLEYLVEKFKNYYFNIDENKYNLIFFSHEFRYLQTLSEYNISLVKKDMKDAIEKKNGLFFLPVSFDLYEDKDPLPYIKYSIEKHLKVSDFKPYWDRELNFEEQIQRIKFLFSIEA